MILLMLGAVYLSFGLSAAANDTAVYAFYFLVAGVALQIASYVKYGEGKPEEKLPQPVAPSEPRHPMTRRQKFAAVGVATLVVLGSAAAVAYYHSSVGTVLSYQTLTQTQTVITTIGGSTTNQTIIQTITITRTHPQTFPQLTTWVTSNTTIKEPDGSTVVSFGVSASGGNLPYSFKALWGDNFTQSSTSAVFVRTFSSNQTIPTSAYVTVTSGDGQSVGVKIVINNQA